MTSNPQIWDISSFIHLLELVFTLILYPTNWFNLLALLVYFVNFFLVIVFYKIMSSSNTVYFKYNLKRSLLLPFQSGCLLFFFSFSLSFFFFLA